MPMMLKKPRSTSDALLALEQAYTATKMEYGKFDRVLTHYLIESCCAHEGVMVADILGACKASGYDVAKCKRDCDEELGVIYTEEKDDDNNE